AMTYAAPCGGFAEGPLALARPPRVCVEREEQYSGRRHVQSKGAGLGNTAGCVGKNNVGTVGPDGQGIGRSGKADVYVIGGAGGQAAAGRADTEPRLGRCRGPDEQVCAGVIERIALAGTIEGPADRCGNIQTSQGRDAQ